MYYKHLNVYSSFSMATQDCSYSNALLRNSFTKLLKVPVVIKNELETWKNVVPFTIQDWNKEFGKEKIKFQLAKKPNYRMSWENNRELIEATISEFISWQNSYNNSLEPCNRFKEYPATKYWAYSAYNYMNVIFHHCDNSLQFDWGAFGFPDIKRDKSVWWIGSMGAHTPCHFDTYGSNLVAQVLGRKKWLLFPPDDTPFMYPTRIPYEESTVWSSVDMLEVDQLAHPLFKNSHPHLVVLEPGDVLYVPPRWWHFVSNLDDVNISINTWIDLDSDKQSRLEEGVVKTLIYPLIDTYGKDGGKWISKTEELFPPVLNIEYLKSALFDLRHRREETESDVVEKLKSSESPPPKVKKNHEGSQVHSEERDPEDIFDLKDVRRVEADPYTQCFPKPASGNRPTSPQPLTTKDIVDAFVHPDVVAVICSKLRQRHS